MQFAIGDKIIYTNPQGVEFSRQIVGLYRPEKGCARYAQGARYLIDSDTPWFAVDQASCRRAQIAAVGAGA